MKIKIIPFRGIKAPVRAHYNDAGADVYAPENLHIPPGRTKKIPLGFGLEIPDGFMGLLYTRSSMAAEGLAVEMPPIDSGYRGEIHCIITNHSGETYRGHAGDRIGQLVIQPVIMADFVTELGCEREAGAFGSTGK